MMRLYTVLLENSYGRTRHIVRAHDVAQAIALARIAGMFLGGDVECECDLLTETGPACVLLSDGVSA